jgi:hypothetical protein
MRKLLCAFLVLLFATPVAAQLQLNQKGINYITVHDGQLPDGTSVNTVRYRLGIESMLLEKNRVIPFDIVGSYSQLADWDLFDQVFESQSAKFRAYNHQPTVEAVIPVDFIPNGKDLRAGYRHTSTGEDSIQSLSVNLVTLNTVFEFEFEEIIIVIKPEVWYVYSLGENSGGYADVYGFGIGGLEDLGGQASISLTHARGGTITFDATMANVSGTLEFDVIPGLNDYQVFIAGWTGNDYLLGGINEPETSGYGVGLSLAR